MRYARIAALATLALIAVWSAYSSDDIVALRRGGQAAVDQLHAQNAPDALLDRVCAQKDCRASRLYWYTDLDEAKAAAQHLGRPIISLHLLGRLDEELSCANSRFFRVMLYSDESIASILRDRYVLHWRSVRPVPHVTIDMGDGRTIRQTITGNSAHYLLDQNGDVLDVLPGLYSPAAFRAQLEAWLDVRKETLREYHQRRAAETGARALELGFAQLVYDPMIHPTAEEAAMRTMSKVNTERFVLRQLSIGAARLLPEQWTEIGERELESVAFSAPSLELMRRKQPLSDAMLRDFRRTVAIDTLYNEYNFHRRIHEWFANGEVRDLASLNERVYTELFLTPSDDPWLGLKPESVFTAIGE